MLWNNKMKCGISLSVILANAILSSCLSLIQLSSCLVSAKSAGTSLRSQSNYSTEINSGNFSSISLLREGKNFTLSYNSCSTLTTCEDCTSAYTCHWCERSTSCHARGSIHGCTWGDSCSKDVKPPKKKNNTCASHTTCSECALASRFCHWCEHDNSCHAVGSRFGCTIGVDCYSNDRCRRSEPESLPRPSSPMKAMIAAMDRIPTISLVVIVILGIVSFGCLSCCFYFMSNIKGAYDDLTNVIATASVAPLSATGGSAEDAPSTSLVEIPEEAVETNTNCDTNDCNRNMGETVDGASSSPLELLSQTCQQTEEVTSATPDAHINSNLQQQRSTEEHTRHRIRNGEQEISPLLHSSTNNTVNGIEDYGHMRRLYRGCCILYYFSLFIVTLIVCASLFFYPIMPVYNICNDEVAWAGIMKNIAAFKLDASFEILASISNPNRISAALNEGQGSFSFNGNQFGTFEIPPLTAKPMAITDFTIIIHISPADKNQAIQLAEAYYKGKLILDAKFEGLIQIPAFFYYSQEINLTNIPVDINSASDRSLCHCPTWDDDKNHSFVGLLQLNESQL